MKIGMGGFRGGASVLALAGLCLLAACAGSKPPAEEPSDPPLDGPSEGPVSPASSPKVKEGMDAIAAQDFAAAKAALVQAQQEQPDDPQAAYYLGVAEEGLGETAAAQAQYEKALSLDPNLVEAAVNLSGLLIDNDQGAAAVPIVKAALEKAPEDKNLLLNYALALDAAGDIAGAVAAYAKVLEKSPDDAELRVAYLQLLAAAGKVDEAKAQIAKLGAVTEPGLVRAVAQVELTMDLLDECIKLVDGVVATKPTPDMHMSRAACKYKKKDLAGAEADYRAALKLDPNFAPGHFYLGILLAEQGKKADARKSFEKVKELAKGTPAAAKAEEQLAKLK